MLPFQSMAAGLINERGRMTLHRPSPDELRAIAHIYHFDLTPEELMVFESVVDTILQSYERLHLLPEPRLPVRYPRQPGYRLTSEENPLGAWAWKCSIKGAASGPLACMRIALKDNIAVAGVPLLNGSVLMDGYILDVDATIVTRILDAGGEVVGKAVCEDLCLSGGSHTSYPGPVRNPHDPNRMAGGSSSGSAALGAAPANTQILTEDIRGLRIGILQEGFGWPGISEPDVDEGVRAPAARFEHLGAQVQEISVPLHREGIHFWNGIGIEGAWSMMVRDEGMGHGWVGYYNTQLGKFYGRSRRVRARDFSPTAKLFILLGHFLAEYYHGRYYAKAQNLRRVLGAAYDEAFREVDLLLVPTIPQQAPPFPEKGRLAEYITAALNMSHNTCPFDVTGHSAMNVPCGSAKGLPIGMMLVGRHFEEATILRAAHAFEQG
jgi:Asp-tRNA(Asn)/Glu-tRNA(Gln) amidotransferase A subunit family amidase